MAGFWKRISGGYARDKKWIETPRVLPEHCRDLQPGSDKFIVTQAFASTPRNLHQYMAAFQEDNGGWSTVVMTSDVKTGLFSTSSYREKHGTPLEVLTCMTEWEDAIRCHGDNDEGENFYVPIKDGGETYKIFAQRYGIHFDSQNMPYMPTTEDASKKKVLLTGQVLTQVFDASKTDTRLFRDWQGLAEVFKTSDLSDHEILAQPHHETFMSYARELMAAITYDRPASAVVNCYQVTVKRFGADSACEGKIKDMISDEAYLDIALKTLQSSTLYYILDKGAAAYEVAVKEGFNPESPHLHEVKTIGKLARSFAKNDCGFSDVQAEAVCSVMQKGRYRGEKYPAQAFIERMSRAADEICADAAATATKKPKRRQLKK